MKINNLNLNSKKLFNLRLLKTGVGLEKINSNKIKAIELHIKKALHIIYKFHIANKRILFIEGNFKEKNQLKNLLAKTSHTFLPRTVWVNGAIGNSVSILKHLVRRHHLKKTKKNESQDLFKISKNYNLIVLLDEKSNFSVLTESLKKRVPIIILNSKKISLNFNAGTYNMLVNFGLKKSRNNTFYAILTSLFKKAKKLKEKPNYFNGRQIKRSLKK